MQLESLPSAEADSGHRGWLRRWPEGQLYPNAADARPEGQVYPNAAYDGLKASSTRTPLTPGLKARSTRTLLTLA